MANADPSDRLRTVQLSRLPSAVVQALGDPSPEVVRAAIRRFVDIEGARAASVLRARLLIVDLSLVVDVAVALRSLGDGAAVDVAIGGLSDQVYTRRLAGALALGALEDVRACEPLRRVLGDAVAGVRAAAIGALAKLDSDQDTARACARLLSDPDAQVRIAAVRGIGRIVPQPGAALSSLAEDADCRVRLEVARRAASLSAEAAAHLFTDADHGVRQTAADAAGPHQASGLARLLAEDPTAGCAALPLGRLAASTPPSRPKAWCVASRIPMRLCAPRSCMRWSGR